MESGVMYLIPITAIIGGITVAVVGMLSKARVREAEIRERIAMIERGLVPAPEKDPEGFDRAMRRYDHARGADEPWDWHGRSSRRYRSVGVTLIGVGLGLMILIGIAGDSPESGLGIGGFLIVLGIAFFVNALFESRQSASDTRRVNGPASPTAHPIDPMQPR